MLLKLSLRHFLISCFRAFVADPSLSLDEVDDLPLRPISIVPARCLPDEPAVAAVFADAHVDVRVAGDLRVVEWSRGHKRVVFGRNDERRDANPIDDPHRARTM